MTTNVGVTSAVALGFYNFMACADVTGFNWALTTQLDINSPEDCAATCHDGGYPYFGLQAQYCTCDRVAPIILANLTSDDCNFSCNNPTFPNGTCGGVSLETFDSLFDLYGPAAGTTAAPTNTTTTRTASSSSSAITNGTTTTTTGTTTTTSGATTVTGTGTGGGGIVGPVITSTTTTSGTGTGGGGIVGPVITSTTSSTSTTQSTTTTVVTASTSVGAVVDPAAGPMITRTLHRTVEATLTSCAATVTDCPVRVVQTRIATTTCYPASVFVCPDQLTTIWYDAQESMIVTQQRQVTITVEGGQVTETVTAFPTLAPIAVKPAVQPAAPAPTETAVVVPVPPPAVAPVVGTNNTIAVMPVPAGAASVVVTFAGAVAALAFALALQA